MTTPLTYRPRLPTEDKVALVSPAGQHHLLIRSSFIHDRLSRWIAWFDRWLKHESTGGDRRKKSSKIQQARRS
jgi:hypothetical protein